MNFDLDEDQTLFKASVERFVATGDGTGRRATRGLPGGIDDERWRALAELGLLALPASEARGGLGGRTVDCVVAAMALGQGLAAEPWLECAYWPLRLLEGVPGGAAIAGRIVTGELRAAVAFAEPAGRYETAPRHVRAIRRGDGWALSGTKHFVLGGERASLYLVTARTEAGAALFALDGAAAETRGYSLIDGSRAVVLTLHEGAGGEATMLGPIDGAIDDAVAETRLIAAAEMTGLAGRLFDDTLAYARERRQFGHAIGSFQAIQHRLVECYAMLEQMRSMLWRAALADRDAAGRWRTAFVGAKAFVAERALHIGHEAIQLHGGMGMSDELAIGHAHKRVLLLARLFGDPASDLAATAMAA